MTGGPGASTAAELRTAPAVVAGLLGRLDAAATGLAGRTAGGVRFAGCGSSHLVGGLAATLVRQRAGVPADAVVASELAYGGGAADRAGPRPLVAISRSGRTTETLAAVGAARSAGVESVLAVVCDARSPLAEAADSVVAMPEAAERAVAQTRSVAAALAFGVLLAERAAGRDGTAALRQALTAVGRRQARWAGDAERIAGRAGPGRLVVLGGAERWWLAREAALKVTEMARVDAVAERVLEVPHGPIEGLTAADTVVVLPAPPGGLARREAAVVRRLRDLVGALVVVGEDAFGPGDGPAAEPLPGQLHALHLLALALAVDRGVDADRPARLSPYLVLDDTTPDDTTPDDTLAGA